MIEFTCTCGNPLRTNDNNQDNSLLCPACGKQQVVPNSSAHITANPTPGEPALPRRRERLSDEPEPAEAVGGVSTSGKAIIAAVLGLAAPFCVVLTGLPALILGFMALSDIGNSRGRLRGKGWAIVGIALGILGMVETVTLVPLAILLPAVQKIRQAAARQSTMNNMKLIGLATYGYHDTYLHFPEAYTLIGSAKGGPPEAGMSWRVALLPYMEQDALFKGYNQKEPWDSPTNLGLQSAAVKTYQITTDPVSPNTYFQVFVTAPGKKPHSLFNNPAERAGPVSTSEVTMKDGTANTLLFAEAAMSVPWSKPQDMLFDPDQPPPPLGHHISGGSLVGMADGSVRQLSPQISPATLKALITRDGNETIADPNW